jgi:hypothetical protein
MGGIRPQATCHPDRPHNSKGLCKSCYDKEHRKKPHIIEKSKSQEVLAYQRAWAKSSKRKEYARLYYKNKDKDLIKAYKKSPKGIATRRAYDKKKRKEDLQFKLANNIRSRLYHATVGNTKAGSAVRDLGCTVEFLKAYLESLFQCGMSWDNYGPKGWHIDHIKQLIHFDLTNRDEFLKACHYTNLQPMWYKENCSKNLRRQKHE